ncbi:MAG: SRPBCC domain-containing protein [Myxococcaceae bacterium]|nr:SRPBCC domain-containing protein [Myxococcaceae bacterium]
MAERIEVSRVIKAPARRIYEAWLDPEEHALMTGASTSGGEGGAYTAWDGYIEGRTTSAEPYTRIVQKWRTTEFPDSHPDSTLTIELTEVAGGTEVKLTHTGLPKGQSADYDTGWKDYYFDPMEKYFASPREKLKEGVEALEEAAERAGGAIEDAVEQAGEALETAAKNVGKALKDARQQARKQAVKAVKKGKQVQKKVAAQAKSLGKKVRALVRGKKAATPKKRVVKKKTAASGKKKSRR